MSALFSSGGADTGAGGAARSGSVGNTATNMMQQQAMQPYQPQGMYGQGQPQGPITPGTAQNFAQGLQGPDYSKNIMNFLQSLIGGGK